MSGGQRKNAWTTKDWRPEERRGEGRRKWGGERERERRRKDGGRVGEERKRGRSERERGSEMVEARGDDRCLRRGREG